MDNGSRLYISTFLLLEGLELWAGQFEYGWDYSVDTKSEIVKILHFKQFYSHYIFNEDSRWRTKKVLKNYIDVNVCIAFLTFPLAIGTALLYIVMTICVFIALGSLFMLHDTKAAIEALIIGFLLSPYGLPMIGATVIAFIKLINDKIKAV